MYIQINHYFHQDENSEIRERIWLSDSYFYAKQFFEIRKDMLLRKVRKATITVKLEKKNYIHIATEEMGFFTLSLKKQKLQEFNKK